MRTMKKDGKSLYDIAKTLRRSTDSVSRHVAAKKTKAAPKQLGRPPKLGKAIVAKIEKTYTDMIAKADAKNEVTVKIIKKRMQLK